MNTTTSKHFTDDRISANERKSFFLLDTPTSRIVIKTIASCHKITGLRRQKKTACIASDSILAVGGTPRNVHAVSTTRG